MSELPKGWMTTTLEVATKVIRGITFPATAKDSVPSVGNVCCLRTANIQKEVIWSDVYYVDRQYVKRDEQLVQTGDILMSMANSYELVGKVAHVKSVPSPTAFGAFLSAVRPTSVIDGRYLFHFLRSDQVQLELREGSSQTTNIANISVGKLNTIEVPLAPFAEQTRIADQLDTLLVRVNACNDRLDAIPGILKRFRQAVLHAAVNGRLTADMRLQHGWAEASAPTPLHELGDLGRGKSKHRPRNDSRLYGGPYPFIQTGDVAQSGGRITKHAQTYSELGLQQSKLWPEGTICITIAANIADTAVLTYPACFPDSVVGFVADSSKCVNMFVKWAIDVIKDDLEAFAPATAQKNINLAVLNDVVIRCPSIEEQREIVRQVGVLFTVADRIEARYTAMRAHAQRLAPQVLAKAFRGELVEQDPQDEPASLLLQRLAANASAKSPSSRGRPRAQPRGPATLPAPQAPAPIDWRTLPNNDWAAPAAAQDQAITACLTAVLKAWGKPMPELEARLATLLCQQPRVLTTVLPGAQAKQWVRLVGDEAKPLPAQVARLQPASNSPWGQAIKRMRARGDLVEAGSADDTTWSLGPGASAIITTGWPDGRAAFVVAYLRTRGVASILPALAPADQAFVHVRAA